MTTHYYLEDATKKRNKLTEAIKKFESIAGWQADKIAAQHEVKNLQEEYLLATERLHLHMVSIQKQEINTADNMPPPTA